MKNTVKRGEKNGRSRHALVPRWGFEFSLEGTSRFKVKKSLMWRFPVWLFVK